ncbi:hypothetical protein DF185_02565 [Marinifilum breve]|uniref:NADP-dependent oxidoreductase domain-containing protein n=1 Tax=Marinifilum breve TaxID=2184082 RepID=A0A2V4A280_9BACT|nr:aldo/keto reductase [Marinifilum breve]PXY02995.1 hypothetical protein DF185_02565 [Marinifilum breve]
MSRFGIGTVQFGLDYGVNNTLGKPSITTVKEILNCASLNGINCLDTARDYGDSEAVIGDCTNEFVKSFDVVTKITAKSIEEFNTKVKDSLFHLKSNKLYGLLFHNFNDFKENEDLWIAATKLKEDGVVKKIGFSLYSPDQIDWLIKKSVCFDIVQVPFNIFDRRFESYFKLLKNMSVEVHVRSIFLQGLFFMEENKLPDHFLPVKNKIRLLHKISEKYSLSIAHICLWFGLLHTNIDKIIVGINSLKDLQRNLSILSDYKYSEDLLNDLIELEVYDEKILSPVNWKL